MLHRSKARLYSKEQLYYLQRDFHAHMIVLEVQVEYVEAKKYWNKQTNPKTKPKQKNWKENENADVSIK